MVAVGAGHSEDDGTVPKPSGLALDAREIFPVVEDEVVARVLPRTAPRRRSRRA
jgi:hypothetical protein